MFFPFKCNKLLKNTEFVGIDQFFTSLSDIVNNKRFVEEGVAPGFHNDFAKLYGDSFSLFQQNKRKFQKFEINRGIIRDSEITLTFTEIVPETIFSIRFTCARGKITERNVMKLNELFEEFWKNELELDDMIFKFLEKYPFLIGNLQVRPQFYVGIVPMFEMVM